MVLNGQICEQLKERAESTAFAEAVNYNPVPSIPVKTFDCLIYAPDWSDRTAGIRFREDLTKTPKWHPCPARPTEVIQKGVFSIKQFAHSSMPQFKPVSEAPNYPVNQHKRRHSQEPI
jgi:hypothetical protein